MSNATRSIPSHVRGGSLPGFGHSSSSGASPLLIARINEKRAELENLRELRDLSGQLASQMQMLEEKLSTLANGTEAVAAVLSNWHNVLRAINMASMKIPRPKEDDQGAFVNADGVESDVPLPQTLVRIPVQDSQNPRAEPVSP